jgi:hypothetical protein
MTATNSVRSDLRDDARFLEHRAAHLDVCTGSVDRPRAGAHQLEQHRYRRDAVLTDKLPRLVGVDDGEAHRDRLEFRGVPAPRCANADDGHPSGAFEIHSLKSDL